MKDMTKGSIAPQIAGFAVPLVLGNLFQLCYNAADSMIVGKFVGTKALAAVGSSNPLMTFAILFINGMCMGASILMGMQFGGGRMHRLRRQIRDVYKRQSLQSAERDWRKGREILLPGQRN